MCRQLIVCARTDARSVEGLEAVVDRAKAYVDAGADMIFPEGLSSEEGDTLILLCHASHAPTLLAYEKGSYPYSLSHVYYDS